jgi:hypothetical protein
MHTEIYKIWNLNLNLNWALMPPTGYEGTPSSQFFEISLVASSFERTESTTTRYKRNRSNKFVNTILTLVL